MAQPERRSSPSFATLLRTHRRAIGFSQGELARRAGYSDDYISMLERGVRVPSPATVDALAKALGLDAARRGEFQSTLRGQSRLEIAARTGASPSAGPLIGRADELRVIQEHLAGHGPPALFLSGEPGIGKTRLLQEAARLAPGFGLAVVAGGCAWSARPAPFSPIVEGLLRLIHEWPRRRLLARLTGCDWLSRLLPELAAFGVTPPRGRLPADQERRMVFGAVVQLLGNVAEPRGTLLLLDDLQWVDVDTIDLLAFLLCFAPRVRILAAYRHTEVPVEHPLLAALAEGLRRRQMRRLGLGPLADRDSRALLGHLLGEDHGADDGDIDRVVHRAEGVPRYLVSLAEAWRAGTLRREAPEDLPDDLVQIVRQRIVSLPEPAQDILRLVTVAGGRIASRELYRAARQREDVVLAAIELLSARGLVSEERDQGYRVTRAIIRDVVRRDTGPARLEVLRQRLATELRPQR